MDLTMSMCPICYEGIPAVIVLDDVAHMVKECPHHGKFAAVVERSPDWYEMCRRFNHKSIYPGYLMDVTDRCNIRCEYCYHKLGNTKDRTVLDIVVDAKDNVDLAPFVLVGGEPTLHPDIVSICDRLSEVGEVVMLTNGIELLDEDLLDSLQPSLNHDGVLGIGLSFHKESEGADMEFIELCRIKKLKISTSLIVIDDVDQVPDAVALLENNQDVLCNIRIKAASNLGVESKVTDKVYVSDMLECLMEMGDVKLTPERNQKVSFADVTYSGLNLMLISWYDVTNVDLQDIHCPPWYRAHDGQIYNFVTAALKNEGHYKASESGRREAHSRVHEAV